MTKITIDQIKKLRDETGAPVLECRQCLDECEGDEKKALGRLRQKGLDRVSKKSAREVKTGIVESYTHNGRVGVLVEVLCETDFVARNEAFQKLVHELALQIASMNPKNVEELLKQEYIRDPQKKVEELVKEVIAKTGENVIIGRFHRLELGCSG